MDTPLSRLVRSHLRDIEPYEPVDPPELLAQRAGVAVDHIIILNGNENPYGASPRVVKALQEYQTFHFYPDPEQRRAREALSDYVGLGPEHLLVGSGADELIDLLLRLVLEPGDRVLDCPPSFGMYPFVTRICGGEVVEVARDDLFNIDVENCLAKFDDRVKAIFIASPNNPTGNVCPTNTIEKLLATGALVVVDETYYEFCGKTLAHEVPKHSNLVVLRSLSKWAGLAGLRVGYAVLPVDLARLLFAMKPPYNLNIAAEVALLASIEDREFLLERVQAILNERERLQESLETSPKITRIWPSEGNFLLCEFTRDTAQQIFVALAQKGISVRYFNTPRLRDCLRISVGLPEHSNSLLQALAEI